jgi:hypothetical protein
MKLLACALLCVALVGCGSSAKSSHIEASPTTSSTTTTTAPTIDIVDQFKIGLCLDSMDLAIAQLGQRENPGDWRRLCDQAQDRLRETIGVTAAEANSEISKVITSISIAVVSLYGNEPMPALATTGLRTKLREIGALA